MEQPPSAFRLSRVEVQLGGNSVLRDIDLSIAAGERIALVGPSGAGKTTLLRVFTGVIGPRQGTVEVQGIPIHQLKPKALRKLRSRIGFVHQDHSLIPNLRVAQNVVAGRLGQRSLVPALRSMLWPNREELEEAHRLLERVGIADKLFQRTDSLSGGQQQRVALARALFQRPQSLLADEPVASVDPARSRSLIQLMVALAEEENWTLVVSLHDMELARDFFPRVIGLRKAHVFYDGSPQELDSTHIKELYQLEEEPHASST